MGPTVRSARAVVFDLDGTLIDSRADIAAATNHALTSHGFAALDLEEIAGYVGDGARLLLARAAHCSSDEPLLDRLLPTFLDYYTAHAVDHTRVMPGVREALDALARLPLAICTNKPRVTTLKVLDGLALSSRFRAVIAGGDSPEKKPQPGPLLLVAERLGIAADEIVMVGDGPQDVECGHAVGARTVGVLGGFAEKHRLEAARPDRIIERLSELPGAIAAWLDPGAIGSSPRTLP